MSLECGAAGAAMDEYVDDSTTCKPVDSINLGVGTPAHSDSAVRPTTQTLARADRLALALLPSARLRPQAACARALHVFGSRALRRRAIARPQERQVHYMRGDARSVPRALPEFHMGMLRARATPRHEMRETRRGQLVPFVLSRLLQ